MSRRRSIERRLKSLGEIREIMSSMKTLAYVETQKLARLLDSQRAVVANIETAAADLLQFHPGILREASSAPCVYVLIGSERGFCGDLNHALLGALDTTLERRGGAAPLLVGVGRKLHVALERDPRLAALVEGPGVAEEVVPVLQRLVAELATLQHAHGALPVRAVFMTDDGAAERELLPPFHGPGASARPGPNAPAAAAPSRPESQPPVLNLAPADLLVDLTDHYLFAALHEMLYAALMSENRRRVAHLEGAVRHLDDRAERLEHEHNALRQEEIIEEIEVILLNAPQPANPGSR